MAESPRPMSDTKKLASPSLLSQLWTWPFNDIGAQLWGCDASSAQFCTQYYYLKVAFQQTSIASIIGLIRKVFVLFISFGSSGLTQEGKSRNGPENLNPFRQPLWSKFVFKDFAPSCLPGFDQEAEAKPSNPSHRPSPLRDDGYLKIAQQKNREIKRLDFR